MNRRILTLFAASIVLSTLLVLVYEIPHVKAVITINADGSIDPLSAPITTGDNILYTFTGNVNDSIEIKRDGITLDGSNFNLTGSGTGDGVKLEYMSNVTVTNIVISNFTNGILLRNSNFCNITDNVILACPSVGVLMYETSHHIIVRGNRIVDSLHGLRVFGSDFNTIAANNITSLEHGGYFYQSSNCSIIGNQIKCERANNKYGIYLWQSHESMVYHNNITEAQAGIYVYLGSLNSLQNNTVTVCGSGGEGGGIWVENGALNIIEWNQVLDNSWHGINLDKAPNTTISGNLVGGNSNRAIMVDSQSSYAQIIDNDIVNNYKGVEVDGAHYNLICENNVSGNQYEGIVLDYASNNTICLNYVSENSQGILVGGFGGYNNLTGNTLVENGYAIHVSQTSHNILVDNHVESNFIGLTLQQAWGNTLRGNTMINNTHNFELLSINLQNFLNDVDDSNTIEGKPIYYWINEHNTTLPSDASCVILVNCTHITVQNLNLSYNTWQAVILAKTSNSVIANNNITGNEYGIWLWNASSNQINQNYLQNFLSIQLTYSTNNTIFGNTLTGSGNWGSIGFADSDENTFYGNNFTNNYIHVLLDEFSTNYWDDGYPTGGNYWDNYGIRYPFAEDENQGPHQNITGSDGIWDWPYTLNDENIDNYPLIPEYENALIIPMLFVFTIALGIVLKKHRSQLDLK